MKATVYDVITDRILEKLEAGTVPWHKPWKGGAAGMPRNLKSKRAYRGINVFLLSCAGYGSPHWLTFRQATQLGGAVRKGEKGFPVVFWKWPDRDKAGDNPGGDDRGKARGPILRYYTVFNVAQCDGIDDPDAAEPPTRAFSPIAACEQVIADMPDPPKRGSGEARAYYRPSEDLVNLPPAELFDSDEELYSTLFHELVHSTGNSKRLGRPGVTDAVLFGSHAYSKEELVAEMGAAFLCGHTGIDTATLDNSAAYIASWLDKLRNDKRLVVHAAAAAQKAADHILGRELAQNVDRVAA